MENYRQLKVAMCDELITCIHCGTKNVPYSCCCYACGKSLPRKEPSAQEDIKAAHEEEIEIKITTCTICRALGKDRDAMGAHCLGCKHNPKRWREVFITLILLLMGIFLLAILGVEPGHSHLPWRSRF